MLPTKVATTVIAGSTFTSTQIQAGSNPSAVAVNPTTGKIYAANYGDNNVTVIDRSTNATAIVQAGTNPYALAINLVTNKIYVANNNGIIGLACSLRVGFRWYGRRGDRRVSVHGDWILLDVGRNHRC